MKKLLALVALFVALQTQAQQPPAFWNEIVAFKKADTINPPIANPILFVGSSSFTKWKDVNNYFPGYPIINRGFGGSTLVDVIRYAYDVILPYKPKEIVIYCGENDLAYSDAVTAQDVFNRFKTLFGMIRTNLPDVPVYYVAIKPSPSRVRLIEKVKEANKLISGYLKKQKKAGFINVFDAMLDEKGQPRPELFVSDMLHMKPEGYAIWQKIIQPYLIK